METLHPAVGVALAAVGGHAVAVIEHPDIVAVLVDSDLGRAVAFVELVEGQWTAPAFIGGQAHREIKRRTETQASQPIQGLSRKRYTPAGSTEWSWFAFTGIAAHDAATVAATSSIDTYTAGIADGGSVFAVLRGRSDETPGVVVHTLDGATYPVPVH